MHVSRSFPRWMVFLISSLLLYNPTAVAQDIPEVTKKDLPGYTLNRNEYFNGASLWGYMNGGADIYLEYGFDILRVEEFSVDDENITLELFRMNDPLSAYGIYSIKTFKCREKDVIAGPDCLNPYQFQMAYGDYYIQLVNESGSGRAKHHMITIAETLIKKLDKAELHLPIKYLTDSLHFALDEITLLIGKLGMQDKAQLLYDDLHEMEGYQVYIAKATMEGENVAYYEIIFDEAELKDKFLQNYDESILQLIKEDDHSVFFQRMN